MRFISLFLAVFAAWSWVGSTEAQCAYADTATLCAPGTCGPPISRKHQSHRSWNSLSSGFWAVSSGPWRPF